MEGSKHMWIWVVIATALLFLFGSFGMGGYGMMGYGMGFGAVFMLLFWGMVVWLIVALINGTRGSKGENSPLTILKKRYVSGEISKKQFEEMKKELER